ncbi:hypothetical protein BC941DRAFT_448178 [Chlamydoabsidia padenii]|nr:hypothetical protein BC941DRAFT_448178 [Chlamydoabsidia padenii]
MPMEQQHLPDSQDYTNYMQLNQSPTFNTSTMPTEQDHLPDSQSYTNYMQRNQPPNFNTPTMDNAALKEEVHRLRMVVAQLETRATQAESEYTEIAAVETIPLQRLREYNLLKNNEFEDLDRQIQVLHKMNNDQEEHLATLSNTIQQRKALIQHWKQKAPGGSHRNDLPDKLNHIKKKYASCQKEVKDYKSSIRALQQLIKQKTEHTQLDGRQSTDTLNSQVALMETISQISFLEHATRGIQYKLEIFKEDGNMTKAQYTPLVLESVKEQFLPHLQDSLEFEKDLLPVFFWRLNTYLNKKVEQSS